MRLDHLLSREKAKVETPELIPRSMPIPAMVLVKQRTVRFKTIALAYIEIALYHFQGSPHTAGRAQAPHLDNCIGRTRFEKDQIISVPDPMRDHWEREKIGLRRKSTKKSSE